MPHVQVIKVAPEAQQLNLQKCPLILAWKHLFRQADGEVTYWAGVEALKHPASLRRLQSHVLAESRVDAEGEGEAASHPLPLQKTSRRRLHVEQHLWPVVVRQGHAAHQSEDTDRQRRLISLSAPTRLTQTNRARYRPWDDQLLSVVDAVRAAIVIWKSAANLSLDVIELPLCGSSWRRKHHELSIQLETGVCVHPTELWSYSRTNDSYWWCFILNGSSSDVIRSFYCEGRVELQVMSLSPQRVNKRWVFLRFLKSDSLQCKN